LASEANINLEYISCDVLRAICLRV
jgi:hypothetical protein